MKKFLLIPLAIVLVTALIFAGCKPEAEVPDEIRIGDSASLTGAYAGMSIGGAFGAQAATEDINKLGGVYVEEYGTRLPVRVISLDNESDPLKSGTLAEDLVLHDKVHFLLNGDSLITITAPISMIADRYKVPYYAGSGPLEPWVAMRESVTPPWEYSWYSSFAIGTPAPPGSIWDKPGYTIADLSIGVLDHIAGQTNYRAAVYATDDPDGVGWYEGMPLMLQAEGYDVLGLERNLGLFVPGTTDFSSMIRDWKDYGCEIMWGCAPGVDTGVLLRQCREMGFNPKMVWAAKAGLFYIDVAAWGGNIPLGVGCERWWDNVGWQSCPGIGDTTAQSLTERWIKETGQPLMPSIGWGYMGSQILFDAIERAGTLDAEAVNEAMRETDLMTMNHRVQFDENHFNRSPLAFGQWFKTDKPEVWEVKVVFSQHDFIPVAADFVFPIPYD